MMRNGHDLGRAASWEASLLDAEGYLLDWDGSCAEENQLVPSAVRFLRENQARTAIVSNNSSNTVADFLDILAKADIQMRPDQIVLAGVETLSRAISSKPAAALVMADPRMRGLARSGGLTLANEGVDLVVLLRDTRLTYPRLERAVNALAAGAKLMVSNPDRTHPGCDGRIKPETGALLAALNACIDLSTLDVEIIGKPGRHLFEMGCRGIGLPPERVLMIGDNPDTDIAGARALGMNALQVGPSPSAFFDELVQALKIA